MSATSMIDHINQCLSFRRKIITRDIQDENKYIWYEKSILDELSKAASVLELVFVVT